MNRATLTRSCLAIAACLALVLPSGCSAGNFNEDVIELAKRESNLPEFKEETLGFDNHGDMYYYEDKQVARAFDRAKYKVTQITLGGQADDITGKIAKPALNPFAVAQKSVTLFDSNLDRWDVKDNGVNAQFFALYHGAGSDYVVNKLRAHLLRKLANAVQDQLPVLDRTAEPDAEENESTAHVAEEIRSLLAETIRKVFEEVDQGIRRSMSNSQDFSSSATVAIVSKAHIITANMGAGGVIGYDSLSQTHDLTPVRDDRKYNNLFGAKKSRTSDIIDVHVKITPRYFEDEDGDEQSMQLLLLGSPSVSRVVNGKEAFELVTKVVQQHKHDSKHEQELYSSSVSQILDRVSERYDFIQKLFFFKDHSVILVGLERDYDAIH